VGLCFFALAFSCFGFWPIGVALWLFAFGVGLSLFSYWFICVAPVRGGTHFSLPAAKKSKQKKAGSNR
jgi:hypothetical protein